MLFCLASSVSDSARSRIRVSIDRVEFVEEFGELHCGASSLFFVETVNYGTNLTVFALILIRLEG